VEANPQVLLVHLEMWRTLRALGLTAPSQEQYIAVSEQSIFYADPHICTACRYRADDMLWRCPHCHEWNTLVEERLGPAAGTR
jgi:lipopolysaccharide biosynthesis regulator YciM